MAFAPKDRVKETTTTTGTGTITLAGAVTDFQSFSAVGNGNTAPYAIVGRGTGEWETGIGTYTSSGTTLARTTVLASSNSGSLVSFSAGTKDVFVTLPVGLFGLNQIGSTLTATSGATSSFTSIPSTYSHLLLEMLGLSHDSGSAQQLQVALSPDGATWSSPSLLTGTIPASNTLYGSLFIPGYRRAGGALLLGYGENAADVSIAATSQSGRGWRLAAGISALRFSWTGSANFDATGAGQINLMGF